MKRTVKSEEALIKWFKENDLVLEENDWTNYDGGIVFVSDMFEYCGKEIAVEYNEYDCIYIGKWNWLEDWLEPEGVEAKTKSIVYEYGYDPKPDITIYELARIIPILTKIDTPEFDMFVSTLEEPFKRHFVEY